MADDNVVAFPGATEPFDFDTWYEVEALDLISQVAKLEDTLETEAFWEIARSIRESINSWPIPMQGDTS